MRIVDVQPLADFRVALRFDNGETGTVDLSHLAGRGVFSAWLEEGAFEAVVISSTGALQWPPDLDLCPDSLYLQMTGKSVDELFQTVKPLTHA
jgi:hypothetical protein